MQNIDLKRTLLKFLGITLLGWCLLSWQLGKANLWIDEYNTFFMIQGSPQQVITAAANDFHPPLYYLLVSLWTRLAGTSDFSLRWPSIAASLLCLPLLMVVVRRLTNLRIALWSVLLLSLAPAAIEFGRMARYYSLMMALGLLSTILLLDALKRDKAINWIVYAFSALGLLYTFYPSGILLLGQGLVFVWPQRRQAATRHWFVTMAMAGLAFAPWFFLVTASQSGRMSSGLSADLSRSLLGLALGVLATGYTFSVGDTIFPWFPVAWIGLLVVASLLLVSLQRATRLTLQLIGLSIICVTFISLTTTYVAVGTPFLNVPARSLFVLPFFVLLLAIGLSTLRSPRRVWFTFSLLALVWAISIFNIFTGQQYLNPIYVTPTKEAAEYVHAHADASDLVISDGDSAFVRYFLTDANASQQMDTQQIDQIQAMLSNHPIKRVWLVTLGRDRTRSDLAARLSEILLQDRRLCATTGFAEQDPIYRQIKERLIGRDAYQYRLTVQEFCP